MPHRVRHVCACVRGLMRSSTGRQSTDSCSNPFTSRLGALERRSSVLHMQGCADGAGETGIEGGQNHSGRNAYALRQGPGGPPCSPRTDFISVRNCSEPASSHVPSQPLLNLHSGNPWCRSPGRRQQVAFSAKFGGCQASDLKRVLCRTAKLYTLQACVPRTTVLGRLSSS